MIVIVDYGMGNVRSLSNAFEYIGCDVEITRDPKALADAERIVLPGVGAFGDAMAAIRHHGIHEHLAEQVLEKKKPLLGICLGMQLLAKTSKEHGLHEGLGWIDASVEHLDVMPDLKVPHVGWNDLTYPADHWLFKGIKPSQSNFYFVHSLHMVCQNPGNIIATVDYGSPVVASVGRDNIVATQFHPEKSQDNGLRLLENFVAWEPVC